MLVETMETRKSLAKSSSSYSDSSTSSWSSSSEEAESTSESHSLSISSSVEGSDKTSDVRFNGILDENLNRRISKIMNNYDNLRTILNSNTV